MLTPDDRDFFAGQALIGLLANSDLPELLRNEQVGAMKAAAICFHLAGEMVAASGHPPRERPTLRDLFALFATAGMLTRAGSYDPALPWKIADQVLRERDPEAAKGGAA